MYSLQMINKIVLALEVWCKRVFAIAFRACKELVCWDLVVRCLFVAVELAFRPKRLRTAWEIACFPAVDSVIMLPARLL
jgi:hypothetical protein